MSAKINVAILCGGRSPEHAISLISAQNVIKTIDQTLFNVHVIGIDKNGHWFYYENGLDLEQPDHPKNIKLIPSSRKVLLSQNAGDRSLIDMTDFKTIVKLDVLYPVLHGAFGEDGSIQGLAKIADIPCVGCGIIGSALGMDKDVMKKILRDANVPVAKSITVRKRNRDQYSYAQIKELLGETVYIKPANLGSSIGVSRAENEEEYIKGLEEGLKFDDKVLVEELVIGREIECAVMGNDEIDASVIGEIIPQNDFYTFENKYVNSDGALLSIPSQLSEDISEKAKKLSIETYAALECKGLSRVDMFYKEDDGTLLINEINTLPGFTSISMYPKLWEYSGIPQVQLVTQLIQLAIEQHQKESNYRYQA